MDKIIISDLEIYAYHGVLPEENKTGQTFYVSAELEVNTRTAGKNDDLEASVDYSKVAHLINDVFTKEVHQLIETCAEQAAEAVLLYDKKIKSVVIEVKKPEAPIGLPFGNVSVRIKRSRHVAYIALGSNLGESEELIREAVRKLDSEYDCEVKKVSTLIRTKPYGVEDQPDFLNGALELETLKTPHELLDFLHEVEKEAGRERKIHWGPRTLDLDILFYDDCVMEEEELCIPHVDMKNRDFVLKPMNEIAPYKVHPVYGLRICEMLDALNGRK